MKSQIYFTKLKLLNKFFFKLFPIVKFSIKELSMVPAINSGDVVLVEKISYLFKNPEKGQMVIFLNKDKYLIKRINQVKGRRYFVLGDNLIKSTDSRHFGLIEKKDIIGKVFFVVKK